MSGAPGQGATHGLTGSRAYAAWSSMKGRCLNKNNSVYHRYGGRGITVCKRWMKFENFFSDMGHPPISLSLERIDNNKGYCPENCTWANQSQQCCNKENALLVEYRGKKYNCTKLAEKLGLKEGTLRWRIKAGITGRHLFEPPSSPFWLNRKISNLMYSNAKKASQPARGGKY